MKQRSLSLAAFGLPGPLFPSLKNSLTNPLTSVLSCLRLAFSFNTLITPKLDYCNKLLVELPLKMAWKCQAVQNVSANPMSGAGSKDSIIPQQKDLHALPICSWAQFKLLGFILVALNWLGPKCLKDHLHS